MHELDLSTLEPERPVRAAPGLTIERRSFIGLAAATLCGAAATARASGAARGPFALPADAHLDFEQFLAEVVPIARALVADDSRAGEDRYLHTLASFAVRLSDVPVPQMEQKSKGDGPKTWLGVNEGGDPFNVLHWKMDPGSVIATHAHAFGNVVTLGLEGSVRIHNYEMVGARDYETKEPFRIRRTTDQVLLPGDTNLVPISHGYCHGFFAGADGARGLDITTRIRPKRTVPLLVLEERPVDADGAVYEARWRFE